mmetsp:Transcript_8363/g.24008  ORF Transcript_8363/g.24008 Transcript_8363/m.24008 type:complete len:345 (+) Transcript_8363:2433-3467(+)
MGGPRSPPLLSAAGTGHCDPSAGGLMPIADCPGVLQRPPSCSRGPSAAEERRLQPFSRRGFAAERAPQLRPLAGVEAPDMAETSSAASPSSSSADVRASPAPPEEAAEDGGRSATAGRRAPEAEDAAEWQAPGLRPSRPSEGAAEESAAKLLAREHERLKFSDVAALRDLLEAAPESTARCRLAAAPPSSCGRFDALRLLRLCKAEESRDEMDVNELNRDNRRGAAAPLAFGASTRCVASEAEASDNAESGRWLCCDSVEHWTSGGPDSSWPSSLGLRDCLALPWRPALLPLGVALGARDIRAAGANNEPAVWREPSSQLSTGPARCDVGSTSASAPSATTVPS